MAWLNAVFADVDLAIGFFVSFLKDNETVKSFLRGGKKIKFLKASCGRGKTIETIETIF